MKRLVLVCCGVAVFSSLFVICGVLYGHLVEGARGWYRGHENRVLYAALEGLEGKENESHDACRVALRVERQERVYLLEQLAEIERIIQVGKKGGV